MVRLQYQCVEAILLTYYFCNRLGPIGRTNNKCTTARSVDASVHFVRLNLTRSRAGVLLTTFI